MTKAAGSLRASSIETIPAGVIENLAGIRTPGPSVVNGSLAWTILNARRSIAGTTLKCSTFTRTANQPLSPRTESATSRVTQNPLLCGPNLNHNEAADLILGTIGRPDMFIETARVPEPIQEAML